MPAENQDDVIIFGAGVGGGTVAYHLAQRRGHAS
jgi:flavin-dependent dehydrogenase